ncbi:MAG: arginine decarboxylase [Chitinophagales bacterium]|nr:arginine decarboxylase [Chitinophagales bacterium]
MKNRYIDLIEQTFYFPQEGFEAKDNELLFNHVPLMELIKQYGTPLRITYLPKISQQIQRAKAFFANAIASNQYEGKYYYSYCTKASHFAFVMQEALKNDIHLETSSAFDIDLVEKLTEQGMVSHDNFIICNGFKPELYQQKIVTLRKKGFQNIIPVLDYKGEIAYYDRHLEADETMQVGIRIAADEEPNFEFYTSRLGIRYKDILEFYIDVLKDKPKFKLKMLHFFINTGIKDTTYYWSELNKAMKVYCNLKKICPDLEYVNIGGGLPIKLGLGFEYDYQYMINEIVKNIKGICDEKNVPVPSIFTEFGSFTVGESGAMIFKVLEQKQQNDIEMWYMIDGSLMTTLPDIWGMSQRFILLPINKWEKEYQRVNIGGLSCDISDYYNAEAHHNQVFMPVIDDERPLYLGFFHVGAYQESLSGYGGTKHCLIPSPKHLLVSNGDKGELQVEVFAEPQKADAMLEILGY